MDADELDNALNELESRLERLRALYQQYFLGIEKIEPSIARKDVERRIWGLRKLQIRNTGKRFKLNVLVQRFNTFQQYWTKTCREIENGTYRRHIERAKRRFGELEPPGEVATTARATESESLADTAAKAKRATGRLAEELGAELDEALDPLEDIRKAMDEAFSGTGPAAAATSDPPLTPIPKAPRLPPIPEGGKLTPFDLDFDDGALPTGRPSAAGASPPPRARSPVAPAARLTPSSDSPGRALPPPRSRLSQGRRPNPDPSTPRPAEPAVPATPEPAPAPPAKPAPPARPPKPVAASTADRSGLSEERIRDLHGKLLAAKRQTNEPATVSEDALARSLRAAEAKLRSQHGQHRRVDFDVVVKNGKAVVKPIVR